MTGRAAWKGLAILLLLSSVAACDVYRHDDEDYSRPLPSPGPAVRDAPLPPPVPPAPESAPGSVVVRPGQTLYGVAREHNMPVRALIDANNLTPPYMLKAGQTLVIPQVRQYQVQPGDTLNSVARRNGVEASSLARANHLNPPFVLKTGSYLVLPAPAAEVATTPSPLPEAPPNTPPLQPGGMISQPLPPPGAPLPPSPPPPASGSAPRFGATPLPPPTTMPPTPSEKPQPGPNQGEPLPPVSPPPPETVGKPVPLGPPPTVPPAKPSPPPAEKPAAADKPPVPEKPVAAEPPPAKPGPPEPEDTTAAPQPEPAPGPSVAALVQSHKPPSAPLFFWPVRGTVISVFGAAAGGTHNDGINIAAPEGTEIDAAESGVVAYAGNELRGFGNLLLIKHADGWVTAYAHNKDLLVNKGDHVKRGQAIAHVGSTGGVGHPQLHFELRQKTTAVDPLDHLPQLGG